MDIDAGRGADGEAGDDSSSSSAGIPPDSLTGLKVAAHQGWAAENRAAAQRFVACYGLLCECVRREEHDADDDCRPEHAVVEGLDVAIGYVVSAMGISSRRAESMITFGWELHERYPAILAAMAAGRMEQRAAEMLARQMSGLHVDVLARVQQQVVEDYLASLESGVRLGDKAVRENADAIISQHDPGAIRRRKEEASRARGVRFSKGVDGMSTVSATLATEEAAVLAEAIDQRVAEHERADAEAKAAAEAEAAARAGAACSADGEGETSADASQEAGADQAAADDSACDGHYSKAERRADALMSLVCGDNFGSPGTVGTVGADGAAGAAGPGGAAGAAGPGGAAGAAGPGGAAGAAEHGGAARTAGAGAAGRAGSAGGRSDQVPAPLRPNVTVIAPGFGGAGGDEGGARVEFTRTGEAALQALLDMLATADGASFEKVDPRIGAADDARNALKYRPSAELARRIRLRDGTCRHPGCAVPAEACDLDHVRPFDRANPERGGRTEECNLMCLCRRHHRFKTFSDWIYDLKPDGTLVVISPEGSTMVTRPSGPLGEYRREQARAEAAAWDRQQRRNPDPATAQGRQPSEPTSWARRDARRRAAQRRADRASAAGPPNSAGARPADRSRWWQRNKPTHSVVEREIHALLHEHLDEVLQDILDPPPF